MVRANLGLAPWDVLAQGMARATGWSFGAVVVLIGAGVLLLWWPLRQKPGLGTVLNMLLIGPAAEVGLWLLPDFHVFWQQVAVFAAGLCLLALATGLYIGARFGAGPRDGLMTGENEPVRYPARQTRLASDAIARLHQLDEKRTVFIQQNPHAIDSGVFHNDVISVSNGNVLFHHEQAFVNSEKALAEIRKKMAALELDFLPVEVPQSKVSLDDAVATYLFNSQLLSKTDGKMMLVVPEESHQHPGVWAYLSELKDSGGPVDQIEVFDLRESMRNGGGPACLRLRVALNRNELNAVNVASLMNDSQFTRLNTWVDAHYRDRMQAKDLADPQLLTEVRTALDELTNILGLGAIYPFQR